MTKILPLLFAIAVAGTSCKSKKENSNSIPTDEVIPVNVIQVQSGESSSTITTTGLVATEHEADLSFKISGVIDKILISEGEFIHKGQLLATLKTAEINSQLQQAQLVYEKSKRDYERINNLFRDSVATLEQLQNAKTSLDIAQKAVDMVSFNSEFAYINSPADGFVTRKISNQGEIVNPGTPVIAISEVGPSSRWLLKAGVSDKEWSAISIAQKAQVEIDAFPGKIFQSVVYRKSKAADPVSGSFQIELLIKLNGENLALGMFGKATIVCGMATRTNTIPYDALIEADGNKAFVFAPSDSNKVKRVPIVIERFDNNAVTVKSGLEHITEVVVSNNAFLSEQSTIAIIK
jgi:RND family efflux transporter MFP subunit